MDINNKEMTVESLKQKIENQANLIKELTRENEELYHQYNHLIIRNGKLLKRVDDFQKIIHDLHIRIEELQLINGNMMSLNDNLRNRQASDFLMATEKENRKSHGAGAIQEDVTAGFDIEEILYRWKNYPGQSAQNGPNMRKQIHMLVHLYKSSPLGSAALFGKAGVGGVTGARYVSYLKKMGLICYTGARKKGHYSITTSGIEFLENKNQANLPYEKESKPEYNRAKIYSTFTQAKTIDADLNDL